MITIYKIHLSVFESVSNIVNNIICILDDSSKDILYTAIDRFSLSFRSINKILKVSRTIADLEGEKDISKSHLLESLSYRRR